MRQEAAPDHCMALDVPFCILRAGQPTVTPYYRMMDVPESGDVSILLRRAGGGDAEALQALLPLLYDELHELAHRQRRRQRGPATLNTTSLLHEAYLKLLRADSSFEDRTHFFRVAAQAMRQILVDYARRSQAAKRGGKDPDATYDDGVFAVDKRSEELIALDEALERLSELSPRQAEVVNMRYFAGFTIPEVAELLGRSTATISRDWAAAQAWLQRGMTGS